MRLLGNIYIVVAILVLTFGLSTYVDVESEDLHATQLEIGTRLERMVRLEEALTSMLVIAVLERDRLHSADYDTVHADLEATIGKVDELTSEMRLSNEISALRRDQIGLRGFESKAIALMQAGNWLAARAVLFDNDYVQAKKLYETNSVTAIAALSSELDAQASRFAQIRLFAAAFRISAVLLLLWVGAMFSRRLRRELAEQARLQARIQAANDLLEQSVRSRTAELEAANRQLEGANRQLESLSRTDGLTGLANRRKFDEVWEAEWSRALRTHMPLAVAMIDVDFFKSYNDRWGHQAGDDCLRQLARCLSAEARRAGELIARYGGEEFVLILPGASTAQAAVIAERIRAAVEAEQLPHPNSSISAYVTVSLGVASGRPGQGEDPGQLIQRADAALYAAKHSGRNRIATAP